MKSRKKGIKVTLRQIPVIEIDWHEVCGDADDGMSGALPMGKMASEANKDLLGFLE
jgi:hypothetical protein